MIKIKRFLNGAIIDFSVLFYKFAIEKIKGSYLYHLFLNLDFNWQHSILFKILTLPKKKTEKLYWICEKQINKSKTKEFLLKFKDIDTLFILSITALYPLFSEGILKTTILLISLFYYLNSFILKREFTKIDEYDMFILLFIVVTSLISSYGRDIFAYIKVLIELLIMSIFYLNLKNAIIKNKAKQTATSLYVLSGLTCAVISLINKDNVQIEGISFFYILCLPLSLTLFKKQKSIFKKAIALLSTLFMAASLITSMSNYTNPKAAVALVAFIAIKNIRFFIIGLLIILFLPLFVWEGEIISIQDIQDASKINRVSIFQSILNLVSEVTGGMSGISKFFGNIAISAFFVFIIIMLNTILRKVTNKGGTLKALLLATGTFFIYDLGFKSRLIFFIYMALTSLNDEEYEL